MKKTLALVLTFILTFSCFSICAMSPVAMANSVSSNLLADYTVNNWTFAADRPIAERTTENPETHKSGYCFGARSVGYRGFYTTFPVTADVTYKLSFSVKSMYVFEYVKLGVATDFSYNSEDNKLADQTKGTDVIDKNTLNANNYIANGSFKDEGKWTEVSCTFTPTTSTNYSLVFAFADKPAGSSASTDITINPYYFAISDLTLSTKSEIPTYAEGNGAVKANPAAAMSGEEVVLTATAYQQNTFSGWYIGEELVSNEATYTLSAFVDEVPTAKFTGYNLLADTTYADWVSSDSTLSVADATAASRYGGKNSVKLGGSWRGTHLTLDLETGKEYTISFSYYIPTHSSNSDGSLTSIAFKLGTNVTYGDDGQQTNGSWIVTKDITSPLDNWGDYTCTFIADSDSADIAISAGWNAGIIISDFSLTTDIIKTVSATVTGNGSAESSVSVGSIGDAVTYTASVNDGEIFYGWYDEDTLVSTDLVYNTVISVDNNNLTARFSTKNLMNVNLWQPSPARPDMTIEATTEDDCDVIKVATTNYHFYIINAELNTANDYKLVFDSKTSLNFESIEIWPAKCGVTSNSYGGISLPSGSPYSESDRIYQQGGSGATTLLSAQLGFTERNTWYNGTELTFATNSTDTSYQIFIKMSDYLDTSATDNVNAVYFKNAKIVDLDERKEDVKIFYELPDGTESADVDNYVAETVATNNGNSTTTVNITYDDLDGLVTFRGWYLDGALKSTDLSYTFNTSEVDIDKLTAKVFNRNILTGAASFEGFGNGESLRVSPSMQGVLPTDDKWGMWSEYGAPNYEGNDAVNFTLKAVKGEQTVKTIDSLSLDESNNEVLNFSEYTVKPHSGNRMISSNVVYRAMVRKIENLKPNTNYTVVFYVNNPDAYNFLSTAVVGNTYDIPTQCVTNKGDVVIYGAHKEVTQTAPIGVTPMLKDASMVKQWKKVSFDFTTGADNFAYLQFSFYKKVGCGAVYIDDLAIFETVQSNKGNAIRATDSALRYKFSMPNDLLDSFGNMQTKNMGVLVLPKNILGNNELLIGGTYSDKAYTPIDAKVEKGNYQYVDGDEDNTYFTVALYNIGVDQGVTNYAKYGVDYSVRPYVIYQAEDGTSITVYGDTVSASIFNVMLEIKLQAISDYDMDIVDNMLNNDALYEAYMAQQTADSWYIDKSHATDYDYSMAVVGDIQITTEYHPDKLHYMYDWIINNKESSKIKYAFSLGDLTNNNGDAEWVTVESQFARLQEAGIDHSLIRGNHDWSYTSKITYDEYGDGVISYDGDMETYYRLTEIGGVKYMMLTLNIFPTDDELNWAKAACEEYSDYNVILSTHAYLSYDNGVFELADDSTVQWGFDPATYNCGQKIYDKLVSKCSNIVMVLCGHDCMPDHSIGRIDATREDGSKVIQLMINHQNMESQTGRSHNLLAMMYFSNSGKNVRLEYFSANNGVFYMEKNQMDIELDLVD